MLRFLSFLRIGFNSFKVSMDRKRDKHTHIQLKTIILGLKKYLIFTIIGYSHVILSLTSLGVILFSLLRAISLTSVGFRITALRLIQVAPNLSHVSECSTRNMYVYAVHSKNFTHDLCFIVFRWGLVSFNFIRILQGTSVSTGDSQQILNVTGLLEHRHISSCALRGWLPGPRLNIKTVLSMYGDFHVKDKTAVRTSYL